MHSAWFSSIFLRVVKFLPIKEGGSNFGGKPVIQKTWIIWCQLLYFIFKSFKDQNSSSFIKFQCILHGSGILFSESLSFYKLKRGGPNFWVEAILQKVWTTWSLPLYFNFKSLMDTNYLSFIRFQCILQDSGELFSESWNFYKLKRVYVISGGNHLGR